MTRYHPGITRERILQEGLAIGLEDLSVSAVAKRLGVTAPAVYRHVASREELEELIGEQMLAEVSVAVPAREGDDGCRPPLLHLARTLFSLCMRAPGMAAYLRQGFPRGEHSRRLEQEARTALRDRGAGSEVAALLTGTVATLAISLAEAETTILRGGDPLESDQTRELAALLPADLPLSALDRLTLTMGPCIDGLLAALPPDRPLVPSLRAMSEEYL